MTVEQLPSSYQYGKVVGRIVHAVADTAEDEDAYPEARPAKGTVRFDPVEKQRRVSTPEGAVIVMHESVVCSLSSTGRLIDSEGRVGVWLIQGGWRVTFSLQGGSVDSFNINVTSAHTDLEPLDLVTAAPYLPPVGATVITMVVPSNGQPGQALTPKAPGSSEVEWVDLPPGVKGDKGDPGADSTVPGPKGDPGEVPDLSNLVTTADPRLTDSRTPTAHNHPINGVTGLQTALDGKQAAGSYASASHNHNVTDITGLPTPGVLTVRGMSGTTFDVAESDAGKFITLNNASPISVTVPTGLTVGMTFSLVPIGDGMVTVSASGYTIISTAPLVSRAKGSVMTCVVLSSDRLVVTGDFA